MRHTLLLSTVVVGALAFVGQRAQSCSSSNGGLGHLSTNTSTSGDSGCIFNVTVTEDADLSGVLQTDGLQSQDGNGAVLASIEAALSGQGDGGSVNVDDDGEGTVAFTVPQGVGEIQITVVEAGDADATATVTLGANGQFSSSPGSGGCTPPPPPSLPVNPMPPEPGQPVQSDSQPDVSDSLGSGVPAGDDSAPGSQNAQQAAVQ